MGMREAYGDDAAAKLDQYYKSLGVTDQYQGQRVGVGSEKLPGQAATASNWSGPYKPPPKFKSPDDLHWGENMRQKVMTDAQGDIGWLSAAADLYKQQAGQSAVADQMGRGMVDKSIAAGAALGATGNNRAALMAMGSQGGTIANQTALQAAKNRMASEAGAANALTKQQQAILGTEKLGQQYMGQAMQDKLNKDALETAYWNQMATRKGREAQAVAMDAGMESMYYGALLGSGGSALGGLASMGGSSGGSSGGGYQSYGDWGGGGGWGQGSYVGSGSGLSGSGASGLESYGSGDDWLSDRRAKDDISADQARMSIDEFLNQLHAFGYRYKDPEAVGMEPGRHTGVMAQDMEKTPAGAALVTPDENGLKRVDYGKAAPLMMASLARLNERLDKVEGKGPVTSTPAAARNVEARGDKVEGKGPVTSTPAAARNVEARGVADDLAQLDLFRATGQHMDDVQRLAAAAARNAESSSVANDLDELAALRQRAAFNEVGPATEAHMNQLAAVGKLQEHKVEQERQAAMAAELARARSEPAPGMMAGEPMGEDYYNRLRLDEATRQHNKDLAYLAHISDMRNFPQLQTAAHMAEMEDLAKQASPKDQEPMGWLSNINLLGIGR